MQGPVYGLTTAETVIDPRLLPNFHYDDIFGTVVNRFLVQAVAGIPLTVYGGGGQTRGYLNLRGHAAMHRAGGGDPALRRASCASSTSSPRPSRSTSWPSG